MKNNIENILKEKGMSIMELARRTGKHYTTIYELVKREDLADTQVVNLVKVAEVLEVELSDLYRR